ncbi:unnamed protein product [Heligmosomoides polygyrus]|uniref:Transmembrane protein n=1 Tax=Heligmosomoides polygyrus TaxID=6339 RepID=A0A183GX06_HELPZ|nr:unnamed protein product [Heligmosomoides polygyrus]
MCNTSDTRRTPAERVLQTGPHHRGRLAIAEKTFVGIQSPACIRTRSYLGTALPFCALILISHFAVLL